MSETSVEISKDAPVLVTGASGYIAGWIVKMLLDDGYTVHATVRDPNKAASTAHLTALAENAPGTLKFFKADLLDKGSFDEAMAGCELVMHTASPFFISGFSDAHVALVRPAVEGTRNVLNAVDRTDTVKRVVLTSSVAAMFGDNADLQATNGLLTEDLWNQSSSVDHQPYSYSKKAAEEEAWKINKAQSRWDMVVINPGMVFGPSLTTNTISESINTIVRAGKGEMWPAAPAMSFGVVDVRDVARSHLLAGFTSSASGRHILVSQVMSLFDIGQALKKHFNGYRFPIMVAPKFMVWSIAPLVGLTRKFVSTNVGFDISVDNSYSQKDLGLSYLPAEQTLREHFQQLIEDGLV